MPRRRRALLLAAALCVAGALTQAAPALAAFGPVEPVSAAGADFVREATAPDGTSLIVWRRRLGMTGSRVEARFRSPDGDYGPVLPISDPSVIALVPSVDVDDAGNGIIAWDNNSGSHIRVQARVVFANGTLGPVKNLTDGHADAFQPEVGMGSTGPALIAWTTLDPVPGESGTRIQATTMTLTSTVAPRQIISFTGLIANEPDVAVNPDGKGVVAWHVDRTGVDEFISARGWERGAGFGTIRDLGPFGVRNRSPDAAVNGDGTTFVGWKHLNSDDTVTVQGIAGTVQEPGGVTLVKISAPDALDNGPPTVGLDDDGDALVAWDRRPSPTTLQVRAREVAADGGLGSGTAVSGAVSGSGESLLADLAITPAGFAMVAWQQFDPVPGHTQIHVRARRIDGSYANQQTLATTGAARQPQITLDPAGDALAVWAGTDGGFPIIQAAAQPR